MGDLLAAVTAKNTGVSVDLHDMGGRLRHAEEARVSLSARNEVLEKTLKAEREEKGRLLSAVSALESDSGQSKVRRTLLQDSKTAQ